MKYYKYIGELPLRTEQDGYTVDIHKGDIISGGDNGGDYYQDDHGRSLKLTKDKLELFVRYYPDEEDQRYWRELRGQAAIAALQVIDVLDFITPEESAEKAVRFANALIKKLQETE